MQKVAFLFMIFLVYISILGNILLKRKKRRMDIGSKILLLRREKNWSRNTLAKKLDVSESIISKYERNANLPSIEVLSKICKVFNITADYLINNARFASFDKSIMDRLQAMQSLDIQTKQKIFEVIDLYVRDANTKKFYSK